MRKRNGLGYGTVHVAAANAVFNKVAVFECLIQQEPHNALYYEEVQRVQKNQHIHVAIKLQHILEADDQFRRSAGLPRLDLPEHLWGIRDMRSAHSREQDFMAITAEIEVLHQQLKEKGMYTVPPALPSTSDTKPSNNVHFQPIDPAHKSPVQTMDQSLLNSSLNLLDDSPLLQSSSSNGSIPCGQMTPQGSVHANNSPIHAPLPHASQLNVPPTPYVNQMAVNQHMGTQPVPILPRISTSPTNLQPPAKTLPSQVPSNIQLQQLPFVDAPPAPTQDSFVKNTASPVLRDTRSKSKNDNVSPPYSTKNGQSISGSMTPSSLVKNLTGTQGCASGTHAPQVTPQVSPNASQQQNSYIHNNIPPMQIPNQLPPSPYFPSPFPPPPYCTL